VKRVGDYLTTKISNDEKADKKATNTGKRRTWRIWLFRRSLSELIQSGGNRKSLNRVGASFTIEKLIQ
jgi:hypothetical protein